MDEYQKKISESMVRGMKYLDGFKAFILRGNVVDLAVGVMIGAAFSSVVNSLVTNLLTPIVGAIFKTPDFSNLSFSINGSVFMYGAFLNSLVSFLIIAFAIYFFVITPINTLIARSRKEDPVDPTSKKCPECKSEVPLDATRCKYCAIPLA